VAAEQSPECTENLSENRRGRVFIRSSPGIQQDVQPRRPVVVRFEQDVQITIAVEVAQSAFVDTLTFRYDRFVETALPVAVPSENLRVVELVGHELSTGRSSLQEFDRQRILPCFAVIGFDATDDGKGHTKTTDHLATDPSTGLVSSS
jgi:hypothetical protein